MHVNRAIAAVAVTVLGLGAGRAPGDACSLLTQTEVNSVVGLTLKPGEQVGTPANCVWGEPAGPHFTNKRVELTLITPESFAAGKTPIPKMTKTPVSGLGDDAYYADGYTLVSLSVKKGGTAFVILVKFGPWSTDQKKAMEKTLAQDALARL